MRDAANAVVPCKALCYVDLRFLRAVLCALHLAELRRSIYSLFSQHGRIMDVVALKTRKMRGQAFVVFSTIASATAAMHAQNRAKIYGRPMVRRTFTLNATRFQLKPSRLLQHDPSSLLFCRAAQSHCKHCRSSWFVVNCPRVRTMLGHPRIHRCGCSNRHLCTLPTHSPPHKTTFHTTHNAHTRTLPAQKPLALCYTLRLAAGWIRKVQITCCDERRRDLWAAGEEAEEEQTSAATKSCCD
jgi:hypothetical protein